MHDHPTIPGVRFKDIPGYPGYCAGDDVSVWSCRKRGSAGGLGEWRQLKLTKHHQGYLVVTLSKGCQQRKMFGVHVLMLMTFVGPCPEGMEACHYPDRDPANCSLSNLIWGTPVENSAHRYSQGTSPAGSNNGRAKLTEDQAQEIRSLKGVVKRKDLAKRFGVDPCQINRIWNRETWK